MNATNNWRSTVLYAVVIGVVFFAQSANARNDGNSLALVPANTTLVILDQAGKLGSDGNQRLFKSAGFSVSALEKCNNSNDLQCLADALLDIKKRTGSQDFLLVTSAMHSQAVRSIYASRKLKTLLSGIILFRTDLELKADFTNGKTDGPPLLIIVKEEDSRKVIRASRRFADHVRQTGTWSWFVMLPTRARLTPRYSPVVRIILHFVGALPESDPLFDKLTGHARWQHPPLNHDGFFQHAAFIRSYPVDISFKADMNRFFDSGKGEITTEFLMQWTPKEWALETFYGFDILAYRDSVPALKRKRFLQWRNHRGIVHSIDLGVYAKYKPMIVVGIDHEKNLFRLNTHYRTKRRYSWKEDETPIEMSTDPLGAFLHFREPIPYELYISLSKRSKLSFDSISFSDTYAFGALDKLPPRVRAIMQRNCIHCHILDGLGGRAGHLVALTGEQQGGFALPLRSYSKDVLKNFLFDQKSVAAKIGVVPNLLPEETAKALFTYLTAEQ